MKKPYKLIVFCAFITLILSIGTLLGATMTKQLIDAPSLESVVKLGCVWVLSAFFASIKTMLCKIAI